MLANAAHAAERVSGRRSEITLIGGGGGPTAMAALPEALDAQFACMQQADRDHSTVAVD
jgi:hypothetical protein